MIYDKFKYKKVFVILHSGQRVSGVLKDWTQARLISEDKTRINRADVRSIDFFREEQYFWCENGKLFDKRAARTNPSRCPCYVEFPKKPFNPEPVEPFVQAIFDAAEKFKMRDPYYRRKVAKQKLKEKEAAKGKACGLTLSRDGECDKHGFVRRDPFLDDEEEQKKYQKYYDWTPKIPRVPRKFRRKKMDITGL